MNQSIKGALLSGLILPGLGQIYLKHYTRGLCYLIPNLIFFSIIFYKIYLLFSMLIEKFEKIVNGKIDVAVLQKEVEIFIHNQNLYFYQYFFYFISIIWLVSIIDAYYLGRRKTVIESNLKKQEKN